MSFSNKAKVIFPSGTAIGALSKYISDGNIKNFQPMNINFGLIDSLNIRMKDKRKKNYEIAQRAIDIIRQISLGL